MQGEKCGYRQEDLLKMCVWDSGLTALPHPKYMFIPSSPQTLQAGEGGLFCGEREWPQRKELRIIYFCAP